MAPLLPRPPPLSRAARVQLSGASAEQQEPADRTEPGAYVGASPLDALHTFPIFPNSCVRQPLFFLPLLGLLIELVTPSPPTNTDLFKSI